MACHGCEAERHFPDQLFYVPLGFNDEALYDVDEQIRALFSEPIDWHEDAALLYICSQTSVLSVCSDIICVTCHCYVAEADLLQVVNFMQSSGKLRLPSSWPTDWV